jgi:chemotaxis protein methyltransferase CheR
MLATIMSNTTPIAPLPAEVCAKLISVSLGLHFSDQDLPALQTLFAARMRAGGFMSADEYLHLLAANSSAGHREREEYTTRFTTGETYFLRDARQFDVIVRQLVPELARRRAATRRLRFWSAACASGEEPYTLAMLLREQAPELAGWDIEIIASDINTQVLDIARQGRYRDWSFRALDEARKRRYFRQSGREWVIDDALRRMVRFERFDLVSGLMPDASLGIDDLDLILCRNVFIYMTPVAIAGIASKFTTVLADGGYLVTGHGELLGHNTRGLHTRVFAGSVLLRKQTADVPELPACQASSPAPKVSAARRAVPELPRRPLSIPVLCQSALPPQPDDVPTRPEALMQQAWRQADRGHVDDARHTCREVMALAPFDPWPYYLQAQLAQESGDHAQTKALLNQALYLDPQLVPAYIELAALLETDGARDRAQQLLRAACRLLQRLPPATTIRPYEHSTAADLLAYIASRPDGDARSSGPAMVPESVA